MCEINLEQLINNKFYRNIGKSASGKHVMKKSGVFQWDDDDTASGQQKQKK